jgi:HD-GYP domain-containing protein (c-di-GMP phosphodiesterase class II)
VEKDQASLEKLLHKNFIELSIAKHNQRSILFYLHLIKQKDEQTYQHSLRVALLGVQIGDFLRIDKKPLLFGGCLHDVGKIYIEDELLKKRHYTKQDMEHMKEHVMHSYHLVKDIHPFTAEVILRHHKYQEDHYPLILPISHKEYTATERSKIDYYARLLALADFYDAITNRDNDKYGEAKKLSYDEVKDIMFSRNHDQKRLIRDLYTCEIFGKTK